MITLVTSNKGKLVEWQRLLPPEFKLVAADIDLEEIQSLDMEVIIKDKARRAYEKVGGPVIVEDVSAGLDKLGGLPGPFIKFFEIKMGLDVLFQLAESKGDPATVVAIVAYYDGAKLITARGEVRGTVVSARGEQGFGFDKTFVPAGHHKTYGEMEPEEKDSGSHRSIAVRELATKLRTQL